MQFNRGMVGVLIVVLSLIASAGLGVITNIETKTVTKEVNEYVADITGAFESEKQQSYTSYNPSSNYNGYTNETIFTDYPVEYTPSSYTNNYPISYESSRISETYTTPESFGTPTAWDANIQSMQYPGSTGNKESTVEVPGTSTTARYIIQGPRASGIHTTHPEWAPYYTPLSTVIQECRTEGSTLLGVMPDKITISIPAIVMRQTIDYLPLENHPELTPSGISVYYLSSNVFFVATDTFLDSSYSGRAIWSITDLYTTSSVESLGEGESYTINLVYDTSTDKADVLVNGNPILAGISPAGYTMAYGIPTYSRLSLYSDYSLDRNDGPLLFTDFTQNTLRVKYVLESHVDYIDTRYGIGIRDEQNVTWANKQQNGTTKIAFSVWNGSDTENPFSDTGLNYSNTATLRYRGTNTTDNIIVSRSSGTTYVTLNGGESVPIGTWNQIELTIDNINGTLTVAPIEVWDNFNNYALAGTTINIGTLNKNNLTSINWTANNTFRLQVSDTTVFFNNYGVVMIDPHITISNLWPTYTNYMVNISKVATIGDSITLGNDTFPIENGVFTVDDKQFDITNLNIYYTKDGDSWDVHLESGKSSATLEDISTYIGMNGMWYFVAGFYNIVSKDVQERSWDPTTYDWYASHLFFWMAGILLLFSILAYKMGYLDGLSILILIVTEVILIIIGGTT